MPEDIRDLPAPLSGSNGKLIGLVSALVCLTILMVTNSVDQSVGMPAFLLIVGYLAGNGVAAIKGKPSLPAIGRRPRDSEDVAA